jgi:hypothetical protein
MRNLPLMRRISDDVGIRQFVAKNSERLDSEDQEFEVYKSTLDIFPVVARKIERSNAIISGTNTIPDLFLMGLISSYDQFLSQLIRCVFSVRPEILSSSDRSLSLKDLTEIGSVEAARERIIEKEIESVIQDSHVQQIEWLERKLNMPLRKDLIIWKDFVEICERRNLVSHTNGIISSQYISVCKDHGVAIDGLKVGAKLKITPKYYRQAVSIVLEFGGKLTQVVWRKLMPCQIEEADEELNDLAYRLISKRMYKEANTLLRFGLFEMKKHSTELVRKMMVVNLANAEKLGGNKIEAEKVLGAEDWSASTDKVIICMAAVRDDVETVIKIMKTVVNAEHLRIADFRVWPVFEKVRSDPKFIEAFEREFGQKMVADLEASTLPKLEAEEPGVVASDAPGDNVLH